MPDLVEWSKQERGHETDTFAKWSKQFSRDVASRISPDYARALGPHLRDIYREVTKPTAAPEAEPTVEAAKPKERPPMSPAEARAKYPTGLDENGEVVPEAYYNQRTPGDISDETRAKLNAAVVEAVKQRGIAPKTVRKNERVEKGGLLVLQEHPELAIDVKDWKPGDVIPHEDVQRAARLMVDNLARESAQLDEKLENDTNLSEGQKMDIRERIASLDRDLVGLAGGVLQLGTEGGRMLQAMSIKRGEGVNAESILRRYKNRAIAANIDTNATRYVKQSADILKKATAENDHAPTVTSLVEAIRNAGIDPKSLVKTNGDLMTADEAVATTRSTPVKIRPEPAPKPPKSKIADLSDRLKAREEAAWARINAKKGRLSAGIDPTLIADYADVGASLLLRKGIDLATWTKEMVGHFGEEIRPHLDRIRGMSHAVIAEERRNERMERDRKRVENNPEKYGDDIEAGLEQLAADRKANQERLRALKAETLAPGREDQVRGRTLGVIPEAPSGAGHKVSTRMTYENRLIARSRAAEARLAADPGHASTQAGIEDMGAVGAAEMTRAASGADWHATMKQKFGAAYEQNQRAVMDVTGNLFDAARARDQQESMDRRANVPQAATPEEREQLVRDYINAKQKQMQLRRDLVNSMKAIERSSWLEVARSWRKFNMLTGMKTTGRNLGGNTLWNLYLEASRPGAVLGDVFAKYVFRTGRRTISGPSIAATWEALGEAKSKGLKEAWEILDPKGPGLTQQELTALEVNREINTGHPIHDMIINMSGRFLGAQDRVFRVFAYSRALQDRAKVMAMNERSLDKTVNVAKRTRDLINDPPLELQATAGLDALEAVFQNPNIISAGLGYARQADVAFNAAMNKLEKHIPVLARAPRFSHQAVGAAIDIPMAFDKTPTNIALHVFDGLGVGYAKVLGHALRKVVGGGMTEGQQRAFATSFGRATLGTGLIALGAILGRMGLMTGLPDDDQAKATRDRAAGRLPGAIKMFGEFQQIMGFTPPGLLMAIGATLDREWQQERRVASQLPDKLLKFGLQSLLEIPALKGASDIVDAIKTPTGKGEQYLGSQFATAAPAFGADIAGLFDTSQRDTRNSLLAPFINRIPGWRNTLPASYDALGRPVTNTPARQLLPTLPTPAREDFDPVDRELVRLDVGLTYPQRQVGESDDTYRQRSQQVGELSNQSVAAIVRNPNYQALANLPDGRARQQSVLKGALEDAKSPTNQPRFDTEQDAQIFDHNTTVEATKQEIISQLHQQPGWFNLTKKDQDALENSAGARVDNFKFRYTGRETEEQAAARFERLKGVAETLADPERRRVYVESLFDEKAPKKPPSVPKPLAP